MADCSAGGAGARGAEVSSRLGGADARGGEVSCRPARVGVSRASSSKAGNCRGKRSRQEAAQVHVGSALPRLPELADDLLEALRVSALIGRLEGTVHAQALIPAATRRKAYVGRLLSRYRRPGRGARTLQPDRLTASRS